jgi:hypothetical protein
MIDARPSFSMLFALNGNRSNVVGIPSNGFLPCCDLICELAEIRDLVNVFGDLEMGNGKSFDPTVTRQEITEDLFDHASSARRPIPQHSKLGKE